MISLRVPIHIKAGAGRRSPTEPLLAGVTRHLEAFYDGVTGPPTTQRDRSRRVLAEARDYRYWSVVTGS